jgi:ubiquinone/menaquinone biosynthesis C-methylase UbiE
MRELSQMSSTIRKIFTIKKQENISVGTENKTYREIWLESTLKKIPNNSRILDAGAGQLQYKKFCSHLYYVSQDFGKYEGKGDQVGLQTTTWDQSRLDIVCDIVNIPEPDESFDAIMCIEVLEHLPNPIAALKELTRLLKPGGQLIVTAPFCSLTHFSPFFYQTGYSENFYRYWYEKFGLRIIDIQKNGNFFEYLAQETRRINSMSNKYSTYKMESIDKQIINRMLALLEKLSRQDQGSNEMLCFGLHVLAVKE